MMSEKETPRRIARGPSRAALGALTSVVIASCADRRPLPSLACAAAGRAVGTMRLAVRRPGGEPADFSTIVRSSQAIAVD